MPKGRKLARGIYQDAHGIRIIVRRGPYRAEPRFPLGTPLDELKQTRLDLIAEREALPAPPPTRAGTLSVDVAAALATLPAGHNRNTVRGLLDHWLRAAVTAPHGETTFGQLPRGAITPLQIRTQIAVFRDARKANGQPQFKPKTIKELRRVLGWVYTTLDGKSARNPVRDVPVPRVTYDDPRGLEHDIVDRILAAMPDRGRPAKGQTRPTVNLSKIRLAVMATTGLHQIEVARLLPAHVQLSRRRIWIEPREKGTGSEGVWHPVMSAREEAALAAFVAAKAFGPFSASAARMVFRRAVANARTAWEADAATADQPWPVHADVRPYDLRHSVGTDVYLATGDVRAAQAVLRQKQISTAVRYTSAGVSRQVEKAGAALNALYLASSKTLPTGPTNHDGKSAQKPTPMPKRTRLVTRSV